MHMRPADPLTMPAIVWRSPGAVDDLHDGVLAQSEIAADQPVAEPVAVHGEHGWVAEWFKAPRS